MARRLERLKNTDVSGSSTSLDRGSSTSCASINAIENVGFDDRTPENAYNKLQHNGNGTDRNVYDDVGPKMRNQLNSKASGQNSSKQRRRKHTRRYRVVKVVLIFLIIFVAIAAMLLSVMLMLGKLGPRCACRKSKTTNQKQGIKSSNGKEKTEKQRIIAKKQENYRNEYVRSVSHDGNYLERRVNKCHQSLCIHRVIQFLVLLSALAALAIVILIVIGVLAPAGCPCNKTDSQSPSIGRVSQEKKVSKQTFHLNLSSFYGVLDDIKANITSFRKQTESVMTEYEGNREALEAAWVEFNSIENAINAFSNRIDSTIGHVNNTMQEFDPDHGPIFNHIRNLNSTLVNELAEIKQVKEQQNMAINDDVNSMNSSIAGKVTLKISAPGPVGSKGEKGFKGSPGIKGGTGAPGVNGITGLKGLLGDKGLRGVNGFPGVNGSKGIPGEKGSAGLVGGAGDIGSAGIVGSTGPRGIGNFSWCIERKISASLTHVNQGINEAAVTEDTNFKVISATCSTDFGHDHYLEVSTSHNQNLKYNCLCRGVAPSRPVKREADVNCILYYMECPINPP